jgi:ABC-type sugar transport system substrate-binding protein
MHRSALRLAAGLLAIAAMWFTPGNPGYAAKGHLVYLVSDLRIPYWDVLWRGIRQQAHELGYTIDVFSAENDPRQELELLMLAASKSVDGIVLSPTNSSAAVTLIKMAKQAGIPVVMADVGSESDGYVSYIGSDNFHGGYNLGRLLTKTMQEKQWQNGRVGIIAIPQKRATGRARTTGFLQALSEAGIKSSSLLQLVEFSAQETYDLTRKMIRENPSLRAIWLQSSNHYRSALDAIDISGKRRKILLIFSDAEPAFLELIPAGVIVAAGVQQPYLMGERAVQQLHNHLQGKPVLREIQLPMLTLSAQNIRPQRANIRRNVLGLDVE